MPFYRRGPTCHGCELCASFRISLVGPKLPESCPVRQTNNVHLKGSSVIFKVGDLSEHL